MASQRDMFIEDDGCDPSSSFPASTACVTYKWIILFHWDEEEEKPFQICLRSQFSESQIRKKWVDGQLGDASRVKKLPGQNYSLFCKVQEGKSLEKYIFKVAH